MASTAWDDLDVAENRRFETNSAPPNSNTKVVVRISAERKAAQCYGRFRHFDLQKLLTDDLCDKQVIRRLRPLRRSRLALENKSRELTR